MSRWRAVFRGAGGLRAGWRLLLFAAAATILMSGLPWIAVKAGWKPRAGFDPADFLVADGLGLVALVLAACLMASIERVRPGVYGLAFRAGFLRRLGEGLAWGSGTVLAVAAAMAALGGLSIAGLALHGRALAGSAALWAAAMIVLGLFEEYLFRGYPQRTLASGIGFWPAAALLSAGFGALHYFTKPRETIVDAAAVALLGFFLCFTLARTGDLWLAVGYHAAFDYAALVVLASPNTGMPPGERVPGHLLETSFSGPVWLTGGDCGLEASLFTFPALALLFFLFDRRSRPKQPPK
ncbi:MAG TPA: type II CAAX endopeptidase family protein [Thermoanaerobaculia bacterium]|nr:type II CAAX endopeptidase family protein [Thermoanaerobaculia bacterium]